MIVETIKNQLKDAMRAKDSTKMTVLRSILAGFTNELVATGKTPQDIIGDESALVVIRRLAKQRKDSIEQFEKAGRQDLADVEKAELALLEVYLPQMMSKEEIEKIAREKKEELGIADRSKMGILMSSVMKELKGKADGGDVKEVVESLLD